MSNYSIKDLESLSGIKAHTLRIWEQRYNIINPKRTDSNIRLYDDQDLKLVLNIALLKDHGYKISDIAKLSLEKLGKKVMDISDKTLNYPDQIHALTIAMIDMDEERFEKIMSTNILQFGFENTMINIIYPFLNRIGTLWLTGSIGPAQEHFISNLIRQKMVVAIDGQVVRLTPQSKRFVVFTPEGEFHEMGVLFANYILRARGNNVTYLGQSLPLTELQFVCETKDIECIFTAITSVPSGDEVQDYLVKLSQIYPSAQVYATGYQVVGQGLELPANVTVIQNVRQLLDLADNTTGS